MEKEHTVLVVNNVFEKNEYNTYTNLVVFKSGGTTATQWFEETINNEVLDKFLKGQQATMKECKFIEVSKSYWRDNEFLAEVF